MSFRENVKDAFAGHNALALTLSKIARGRADNGRPIAAEMARQFARDTLTELGLDWTHVLKVHAEMSGTRRKDIVRPPKLSWRR